MQLQDIINLYYNEEVEDTKIALGRYLNEHPTDVEALLFKAEIAIDEVPEPQSPHEYTLPEDYEEATIVLKKVLSIAPNHIPALDKLLSISSINFLDGDAEEHQGHIDQLILAEGFREKAAGYGLMLNSLHPNATRKLHYLDIIIEEVEKAYGDDRQMRDILLTMYYDDKAKVLYDEFGNTEEALAIYRAQMRIFIYETVAEYIEVAHLAIEANDTALLNHVIGKTYFYFDHEDDAVNLIEFYHDLQALPSEVLEKLPNYEEFCMIMERSFPEELNFDIEAIRAHAQQVIDKFPNRGIGYHFLGTSYYMEDEYEKALPLLEKALTYSDASASTVYRYSQSYYFVHGSIPTIPKWPESSAIDYYNMGVYFEAWESDTSTAHNSIAFLRLRKEFYARAFEYYQNYFVEDQYDSVKHYSDHYWATCCNNYSLALYNDDDYEKSIEVAKIGLSKSPFIELYISLTQSYFYAERYQDLIDVYDNLDMEDVENTYFIKFINLSTRYISAKIKLGDYEAAKTLFAEIDYKFTDYKDHINLSELDEDDLLALRFADKDIQSTRFDLIQGKTDLPESEEPIDPIAIWEDQSQRNPLEPSPWFMLFQAYYEAERYEDCIRAATQYKKLKLPNEQPAEDYLKQHYQRGRSYFHVEKYPEAQADFEACLSVFNNVTDEDFLSSKMDVCYYYAQASFFNKDYQRVLSPIEEFLQDYTDNNYTRDTEWQQAILYKAKSLKALGEDKKALTTVKEAAAYDESFTEAKALAQEWKGGFFSFFK
ncbi:hypothetical protein J5U18_09415 [Sphingobacteriaceae bacterium WQ 2009]|uniref:Tetratricopeptide repeat-containing protein n=1 Tax=Rhinopithecimicrobium faecis TaxID=2820698 RepID=A0A8T4H9K2_9SPHI|nr:hypothetical protein [Sphingobacteriaceae bacterium WQ 2009]